MPVLYISVPVCTLTLAFNLPVVHAFGIILPGLISWDLNLSPTVFSLINNALSTHLLIRAGVFIMSNMVTKMVIGKQCKPHYVAFDQSLHLNKVYQFFCHYVIIFYL